MVPGKSLPLCATCPEYAPPVIVELRFFGGVTVEEVAESSAYRQNSKARLDRRARLAAP